MDLMTTMTDWLNRLQLIDQGIHGDGPPGGGDPKNLKSDESGSAKNAKSPSTDTSSRAGHESIIVSYQRFWFDYDLRDGTYTPAELQRAKLLVKRGPVLRYQLRWPGGRPQPIGVADEQESRLRSQPNAVGAPVGAVQRRPYSGHTGPDIKCL
jgi:hypothetical protein